MNRSDAKFHVKIIGVFIPNGMIKNYKLWIDQVCDYSKSKCDTEINLRCGADIIEFNYFEYGDR